MMNCEAFPDRSHARRPANALPHAGRRLRPADIVPTESGTENWLFHGDQPRLAIPVFTYLFAPPKIPPKVVLRIQN